MADQVPRIDRAAMPSDEEVIASYQRLRKERYNPYMGWLMLIKELRLTHQCSVLDAERVALSNPHMRRYVERAINAGNPSRKRALWHIRHNGENSLIEREGESFKFRIPPP